MDKKKKKKLVLDFLKVICLLYIPISIAIGIVFPHTLYYLIVIFIADMLYLAIWIDPPPERINETLKNIIPNIEKLNIFTLNYPGYRFVDIYNAVNLYLNESQQTIERIDSYHSADLSAAIKGKFYNDKDGITNKSESIHFDIAPNKQAIIPIDIFWTFLDLNEKTNNRLIRIRYFQNLSTAKVEIACKDNVTFEILKSKIELHFLEKSIFKNQTILMNYRNDNLEDDGYELISEKSNFSFLNTEKKIKDSEIIIDEKIKKILKTNIFDLFSDRELFEKKGINLNRGLLFYGQPGTGKTYTSRYILDNLENVTKIVVSGKALTKIEHVFNIARKLQPSLVIIEDVDLVFSDRSINQDGSMLAELFDQLDGFKKNDSVVSILTTNSIERVEKGIKNRPGRISQCIHFDLPNSELRKKYINSYLSGCETKELNLHQLSEKLAGATQSFIKELIQRAKQYSIQKNIGSNQISMTNAIFEEALDEMVSYSNHHTENIIGYRNEIL
ncbi:AAA family ATPase [Leptospira vanthielii]|uniref:ATP-binding protein n=1 Tax=Leptospira vanthielii TaxID=293085 RepID=A0ABY2NPI7_9LEPT|nr:ATP-binding protein [Leptospira vanthielii]TGM57146.1 ATP-binding protein [Leptospira vanthielii]